MALHETRRVGKTKRSRREFEFEPYIRVSLTSVMFVAVQQAYPQGWNGVEGDWESVQVLEKQLPKVPVEGSTAALPH